MHLCRLVSTFLRLPRKNIWGHQSSFCLAFERFATRRVHQGWARTQSHKASASSLLTLPFCSSRLSQPLSPFIFVLSLRALYILFFLSETPVVHFLSLEPRNQPTIMAPARRSSRKSMPGNSIETGLPPSTFGKILAASFFDHQSLHWDCVALISLRMTFH